MLLEDPQEGLQGGPQEFSDGLEKVSHRQRRERIRILNQLRRPAPDPLINVQKLVSDGIKRYAVYVAYTKNAAWENKRRAENKHRAEIECKMNMLRCSLQRDRDTGTVTAMPPDDSADEWADKADKSSRPEQRPLDIALNIEPIKSRSP